jgi:polyhydroxyalkanoate synthesis regulator phasin
MDAGVQGADLTDVAQKIKDKMLEGGTMDTEQLQEFLDEINKYIENSDLKLKFDIDTKSITDVAQMNIKDAEKMTENWMKASSAINTVSSAMQSLEDPAAKVMATIAQAIATIALSYAEASLMAAKNPLNAGWGWIAFAATGAATMMSSIAAIHSATGYAQGGIVDGSNGGFVGGSAFSGDQVGNVRLNSGELVLSRSQQFALASQLEGDGNQGTTPSRPYVSGEQIYLGLNNYLRRSGRGEIITSR